MLMLKRGSKISNAICLHVMSVSGLNFRAKSLKLENRIVLNTRIVSNLHHYVTFSGRGLSRCVIEY